MTDVRKKKIAISLVILVTTFAFVGRTLYSTIITHNTNLRSLTQRLALSCNLFQLKTGKFPSSLEELSNLGDVKVPADSLSSLSYEQNLKGSDATITANLYFGQKYAVNCLDEIFPN
ncbi:MAG: hypothetical protein NT141_04375 [candidate division WWE3 bacterium]|nr:hypothetical protein [candidate division WWE3 bacterium]